MNIIDDEQIEALAQKGWFVQEGFLPATLCAGLLQDFHQCQARGALRPAAVGRGDNRRTMQEIRTDQTFWLTGDSPVQMEFLSLMDRVRCELNRALYLGLSLYEAHYACYLPGGFYKKHLDSFKGKKNRIVSTVLYLTSDWQECDQGHLVLYDPADHDRETGRVLPVAGTLACFMSEDIPHEVLPPRRERVSIAGWFRISSGDILDS